MAIHVAFLTKLVQGLNIIMLAILLPYSLSIDQQGVFFLFVSFSSLHVFVELGLSNVLIIYYSKNWKGYNSPTAGKIVKIYKNSVTWFYIGGIILGGFIFVQYLILSINQPILVRSDVFISALLFAILFIFEIALLPRFLFIAGVRSIEPLYLARFFKFFFEFLILMLFLLIEFSFFAFPAYMLFSLTCSIFLIYLNRKLLNTINYAKLIPTKKILWFSEIWKMQWRFSLAWIFGYFTFAIFTPLSFWLAGPETAGRIGFTLAILNGLMGVTNVITVSKVPDLAKLAGNLLFDVMDGLLKRLLIQSSFIYVSGSIVILGLYIIVEYYFPYFVPFFERIVELRELIILMVGGFAMILTTPLSYYIFSFSEMPFLPVSILTGISVLLFTSIGFYQNNLFFVSLGYTLTFVLISLPLNYLIFAKKRRELINISSLG